jgi:hypothetical protein
MPSSWSGRLWPFAVALSACAGPVRVPENAPTPIPASEVRFRRQVFSNERVTAFLLELPLNQATLMHRHDKDIASVFVNGGRTIGTFEGRAPVLDTFPVGEVRFRTAGFTHSTHNVGSQVFRSVILEFNEEQGPAEHARRLPSEACTALDVSCAEPLFCTAKVCVERVYVAPGAVWRSSRDNEQLIIAVTDVELDDGEGGGGARRKRSSGEVDHLSARDAHAWRNATENPARFIVVTFR